MKDDSYHVVHWVAKMADYSEGLTSLLAGSYVLSLAVTKSNVVLRVALGVAGAYLILRSGGKLRSGSFRQDVF